MIIKLAFKKDNSPIFSKSWFISKIIELKTFSRFSHVEMIIGDKWVASGDPVGAGVTVNDLRPLSNDGVWEYVDVYIDDLYLNIIMGFIYSQVGTKYDWLGALIGGGFDIDLDEKDKWFCSEFITEILRIANVPEVQFVDSSTVSPGDLYRLFK